jgi:hypothetical protein
MIVKDVSRELNVSHAYTLTLIGEGKLVAEKESNGVWNVDADSVRQYKESRQPRGHNLKRTDAAEAAAVR